MNKAQTLLCPRLSDVQDMTASPEAPWSSVKQSVISRKLADGVISFCAHDVRCAQARTGVRRAGRARVFAARRPNIGVRAPRNRSGRKPHETDRGKAPITDGAEAPRTEVKARCRRSIN